MTNLIKLIVVILVVSTLSACGGGSPSTHEAKEALQARLGECDDLEITGVDKTNGVEINEGVYQIDVKYTIKFTPNGHLENALDHGTKNLFVLLANVRADCPTITPAMQRTIAQTNFGADGDSYEFTETIAMVKSDNGWVEAQ